MKNKKSIIIVILLIVFIIVLTFLFLFKPIILLNGNREVTINLNDEYEDEGASVYSIIKPYSHKLYINNKINKKKVGKYKIVYSTKFLFLEIKKSRIVNVVDVVAPIIKLKGSTNVSLCPDSIYKEEGYSAYDNYDKDLTSKIIINREIISNNSFYIKYKVSDSSNNTTTIYRKIVEQDNVNPEIKLNGDSVVYLNVGAAYKEEGYFVKDNCDKEIEVKIKNGVDINKPGVYNVEYIAIDSFGNESKISRKVYVLNKNSTTLLDKKGVIYLTFDDGPNDKYTPIILDILKEENVKATFFVTMNGPDALIKREYDEGHSIGLHTAYHQYNYIYSSIDNYFKDINIVSNRVYNITGIKSKIIRFAGGSSNTVSKRYSKGIMTSLTKEVINRGYYYYDWNISSGDAGDAHSSGEVYKNVVNNLNLLRSNMVLMHDVNPYTVGALKDIIEYGKRNGYTFERITEDTKMVTHRVNN